MTEPTKKLHGNLGKKHKPETIEKMRMLRRGRKKKPETKEKMSLSQLGNQNAQGNVCSLSVRVGRRARMLGKTYAAKQVIVADTIYPSLTKAAEAHHVSVSTVMARCKSVNFPNWEYYNKGE